MQTEHLDLRNLEATPERLRRLGQAGLLSPPALRRALALAGHAPDRSRWRDFLDRLLLVLGAGSLLSGVFFFFAYNWAGLHRFVKLGLLETAILLAVALAAWQGLERLSGKVALSGAALLVGATLGVYGQVYQTGADAFQLFLTWALLISGWVLLGRFTPLWGIWMLLLNLSLAFYWEQQLGAVDGGLYLALFVLDGGGVLAWELAHARGVSWLASRWAPRLLALLTLAMLLIPTFTLIFDSTFYKPIDPLLSVLALLYSLVCPALLYLYTRRTRDMFMLAACLFSLLLTLDSLLLNALDFETAALLLVSLLTIGLTALIVGWLQRVATTWEAHKL